MKTTLRTLAILLAVAAAVQLIAKHSWSHDANAPILVASGEPTG